MHTRMRGLHCKAGATAMQRNRSCSCPCRGRGVTTSSSCFLRQRPFKRPCKQCATCSLPCTPPQHSQGAAQCLHATRDRLSTAGAAHHRCSMSPWWGGCPPAQHPGPAWWQPSHPRPTAQQQSDADIKPGSTSLQSRLTCLCAANRAAIL
jgi:hypothetical protein